MGYKTRVTFDCEFSGQRRNYAPTTTEGRLIVESSIKGYEWGPFDVPDEQAKRYLKALVGFADEDSAENPFAPLLKEFVKESPGVWKVFISARYND